MLKDLTQREWETFVRFELVFDDGHNNGFGFPCDANGVVKEELQQSAIENLAWCKAHPEKFIRFNEVITICREYMEPARGICICGAMVILEDQYYGTCQCQTADTGITCSGNSFYRLTNGKMTRQKMNGIETHSHVGCEGR